MTVEEIAQRLNLKPQHANGKAEYHGPNPNGVGATNDGFILYAEGNAWDRATHTKYTSAEVARMAGIDPAEYGPVQEWREQNNRNGHAPPTASPPRRSTPAAPLQSSKTLDKRPLEERGITPATFAAFQITKASDEKAGAFYNFPTHHPDETRGRKRRKFQYPDRAGTPEKPQKYSWLKSGGEGIPVGYGIERIKPGTEIWFVNGEPSVWLCHQEGITAICLLGEGRNPRPMLEAAKQRGAATLRVLLDNDATGCNATAKAIAAAREIGLLVTAHQWPEGLKSGYDAADLWEECRRNGRDFRAAVEALPQYIPAEASKQRRAATPEQIAVTAAAITASHGQRFPELTAERIPIPTLRTERGQPEYDARQLVELLYPQWHAAALTTEAAHGERIAHYMGDDLRHCAQLGFLHWNDKHWETDDREATATIARAARLSEIIRDEAAALFRCAATLATSGRTADAAAMSRAANEVLEHAQRAERRNFLAGALTFAAGALKIGIEAFEPKAWRIGFLNGVWERGQWREHRRDDYLLHVCPVEVDQQSGRDEWYTLLQRMTGNKPEDAELARTLQESVGYTLAGASHLRTLLWAYGPKGTGKSTLAELLQTTLGQQAATIDTKALQDDSSRERLGAAIWGKRLAIVSEAGNKRIDAELLKTLGGGDSLTVRFLYREPFNAAPHHVLLLCANDPPRTDAYDDALRDRVLALPFVHPLAEGGQLILTGGARVEEVRRDPANPLVRGFAAWALEGLARVYRTQTIYRAPAVEAATARFWADADPLTPFWEAISEEELREGITKSALRERYEEWCKQEGMRPVAARTWTRACEAHGLKSDRHKGGTRIWITDKTDKTSPVLY